VQAARIAEGTCSVGTTAPFRSFSSVAAVTAAGRCSFLLKAVSHERLHWEYGMLDGTYSSSLFYVGTGKAATSFELVLVHSHVLFIIIATLALISLPLGTLLCQGMFLT